mmetsp:Transcript_13081/g.18514  ORF Transcript_13081/g.18514 Transcript_13081/m.18514 type:complete len:270 (+) Transcript_13081:121-930(+)
MEYLSPFTCITVNVGPACTGIDPQFGSLDTPVSVIEGAFVHPSFKNISETGMNKMIVDDDTVASDGSDFKKSDLKSSPTPRSWNCCKSNDAVVLPKDFTPTKPAGDAKKKKAEEFKMKLTDAFDSRDYSKIPQGILIYQLDPSLRLLRLLKNSVVVPDVTKNDNSNSNDNGNNNKSNNKKPLPSLSNKEVLKVMIVKEAQRGSHPEGRAIDLLGIDGSKATIIAYSQKTVTQWVQIINNMEGNVTKKAGTATGGDIAKLFIKDVKSLYK